MLIPFENMSDDAKVWVYQADRRLTDDEVEYIEKASRSFFEGWAAHGVPLRNSFKLFHHQFLVIAVDENFNDASGCSIDNSVSFIKEIEQQLSFSFFDRTQVAFLSDGEVISESLSNLKSKVDAGVIDEGMLTFNNLISKKGELESAWVVPAKSTWLSRYFK